MPSRGRATLARSVESMFICTCRAVCLSTEKNKRIRPISPGSESWLYLIFPRQLGVLALHLNKFFSRLLITTSLRNNVRRTSETCHCFRGTGILRFGLLHTRRAAFLSTKLHWNVFPNLDIVLYHMGFLESRTVS